MSIQILTNRLRLRQWRSDDIDPFAHICADPEVMKYIADGNPRTREQTLQSIKKMESGWEENGFGLFAVERKETETLIGFAGLSIPTFLPEILPAVEIGWRLSRESWGKGFATEAALACIGFAKEQDKLNSLVSICQKQNIASERIMKKIGMSLEKCTTEPTHGLPVLVYRIKL